MCFRKKRERGRDKEGGREIERDRETERQRDRGTERQRDRETERESSAYMTINHKDSTCGGVKRQRVGLLHGGNLLRILTRSKVHCTPFCSLSLEKRLCFAICASQAAARAFQ